MSSYAQKKEPFLVNPEDPRNPGSLGHPIGCKPCNKYKPERPNDSCKHAATCSFCHGKDHERPKHRGQRGRHALQRRQFLESRDVLNDQLVLIIDRIYKEPHEIMDEIKRRLRDEYTPGTPEWDREVAYLVGEIANIGDKAQNQRPDNARVRKARAEQPPESSQVDLESRCKWYTGTLHLMVRKMWDEHQPEDKKLEDINKIVTESLGLFKALVDTLTKRLEPSFRSEETVKAAVVENAWLAEPLLELVQKEASAASLPSIQQVLENEVWKELKVCLPRLRPEATEGEKATVSRKSMSSAESLEELLRLVKDCVDHDAAGILGQLVALGRCERWTSISSFFRSFLLRR
ncbi:unnamed protein product [Durusdinium trenchii]|uniref:C3H1-type domain-containing protein n=1 Tax=Durusdinium trenchii TaxID=1381693 RepID=A0ABP0MKC1_9DINO